MALEAAHLERWVGLFADSIVDTLQRRPDSRRKQHRDPVRRNTVHIVRCNRWGFRHRVRQVLLGELELLLRLMLEIAAHHIRHIRYQEHCSLDDRLADNRKRRTLYSVEEDFL